MISPWQDTWAKSAPYIGYVGTSGGPQCRKMSRSTAGVVTSVNELGSGAQNTEKLINLFSRHGISQT